MDQGRRKSKETWIAEYAESHQHPINRACHLIGIPLITASMPLALLIFLWPNFWPVPLVMFVTGWALQFLGHAIEGKPPEFLRDWRFFSSRVLVVAPKGSRKKLSPA